MKHFRKVIFFMILLSVLLIGAVHIMTDRICAKTNQSRYVFMNYFVHEIQEEYDRGEQSKEEIIDTIYYQDMERWKEEFGVGNLPESISFEELSREQKSINIQMKAENNSYMWNLYNGKTDSIDSFIVFCYEDDIYSKIVGMADIVIVVITLVVIMLSMFIYYKILKPFENFSEYPERLSKGEITEKLPELKNRYFGKYIWGMNMLSDKLLADKKQIQKLSYERQTFISTIAHGIKTPVQNIKLYADAIRTGLYQEDGVVNEKDAQIAGKIGKNAEDIEKLVTEMIKISSMALFEYIPEFSVFYLKELEEYILLEYENRFRFKRIPFSVKVQGNPIIESDKQGILRMLGQLLDNAIKYGDGTGVAVTMEKQEEGYYFSVKNRGKGLPSNEIPYVFNSFWRGTNAKDVEGSGIGLFETRNIARALGGEVYIKNLEGEVEVAIFLLNMKR